MLVSDGYRRQWAGQRGICGQPEFAKGTGVSVSQSEREEIFLMWPTQDVERSLQDSRTERARGFVLLLAGLCAMLVCLPAVAFGNQEYMTVTFDDKAIDQPIGTGGPSNGEPSWIEDGFGGIVRSTPFATPCLELSNLTGSGEMGFDLASPVNSGVIAVVADLWLYEGTHGTVALYLRNSSNQQIATIWFMIGGVAKITALGSDEISGIPYATGRPLPVLMIVDFNARTWSVWIDQVQWANALPLHAQIHDFNRVMFGAGWSTSEGNHCALDQIRILDYVPEVPVKATSWGKVRALYR
jgi:hypothetical protein